MLTSTTTMDFFPPFCTVHLEIEQESCRFARYIIKLQHFVVLTLPRSVRNIHQRTEVRISNGDVLLSQAPDSAKLYSGPALGWNLIPNFSFLLLLTNLYSVLHLNGRRESNRRNRRTQLVPMHITTELIRSDIVQPQRSGYMDKGKRTSVTGEPR